MRVSNMIDELVNKGLSEHKLAKEAKLSRSTINRIRNRQTQHPKSKTLDILQKIYDKYRLELNVL